MATNSVYRSVIPAANKLLTKPLAQVPDSLFLEYSKDGNRTHWQNAEFERRGRIARLTLAEAFEDKGRFLPAIEQLITSLCAEKTWVYPAHDGALRNFHGQEITPELGATGLGAELAEADYILGDKLSPATRKLILNNVRRRVLEPFRNSVTGRRQPPLHWLFLRMNWNAVCVGNTVFAALALEPARDERALYAAAGEKYIHYFLSGFTPDGYCAEGVGYWNYGYGHFIILTEALRQATGNQIDLLNNEQAASAALFCRRSEILPGIYPSISDCTPGARPDTQFAAYVGERLGLGISPDAFLGGGSQLAMTAMFMSLAVRPPPKLHLDMANFDHLRSYFPNGGVLIARSPNNNPPFAVCLKGGNNNEPHNHNDVASFSVVVGHDMVICDPGGEVYTKRTFGPHRYDSNVLNSFGHAVPVIAGQLQRSGAKAQGIIVETNFTAAADTLKLDYRSAYAVPSLKKLNRTFIFHRKPADSLDVSDEVAFSQPETFETALITWGEIKTINPTTLEIKDHHGAVRVSIETQGHPFHLKQELIDEDVESKRKPYRLGISLDDKITTAVITLHIVPFATTASIESH